MDANVGDFINFKCDIEQWAEVVEVCYENTFDGRAKVYKVKAPAMGFSGHYIGRDDFAMIEARDVFGVDAA